MKTKTTIKKVNIEGEKVWQWRIMRGRHIEYGGLCATKADARNDAAIVGKIARDGASIHENIGLI